jgi:hypothetical protein
LRFLAILGKKVFKTSCQQKNVDVVVYACHPRNGRKVKIGFQSRLAWSKSETLAPK